VLLRLLLAAGIAALLPRPAGACTCSSKTPPCSDYWQAAAVFRGRVESIERAAAAAADAPGSRTVTFSVLEPFTGVNGRSSVRVTTPGSTATCGYKFSVGREYVVYAAAGPGETLVTTVCSRTTPVERGAADLAYARGLKIAAPSGRITGRVVLRYRDLARGRDVEKGLSETPLTLRNEDRTVSARTDRDGAFVAAGLDAGTYSLELDLPKSTRLKSAVDRVSLADARGCSAITVAVVPDGRVAGRVLDAQRRPVSGLTVDLSAASGIRPGAAAGERLQTTTGRDGGYEFAGVPPGRFVVGINTGQERDDVTRVHHPALPEISGAALFALLPGGAIDLGDLKVPVGVEIVQVTGFVFDLHGTPVENARVYLRGPNERDFIIGLPVTTDFMGRFVIAAAADREYQVFAERPRPGDARGRIDVSDPIAIVASSSSVPVKLHLRRP
jgi:hypothetical protein